MELDINDSNGVNGTVSINVCSVAPGSGSVWEQADFDRHWTTVTLDADNSGQPSQNMLLSVSAERGKRHMWSEGQLMELIYCYLLAQPGVPKYRKRMHGIWIQRGNDSSVTEQHLADQRLAVIRNKRIPDARVEELRKVACSAGIHQPNYSQMVVSNVSSSMSGVLNQRQQALRDMIASELEHQKGERTRLPALRSIKGDRLLAVTKDVNEAVATFVTDTLTDTNRLMYAAAVVVSKELGFKVGKKKVGRHQHNRIPPWKMRLENKIGAWRKDLSRLEVMQKGKLRNCVIEGRLREKYALNTKPIGEACEEVKQLIVATSKKIVRYEKRVKQYTENKMFHENQKRLFQRLDGELIDHTTEAPNAEDMVSFWKHLWDRPIEHSVVARWITTIEKAWERIPEQKEVRIHVEMVQRQTRKMKSWTAPGPDQVHAFWLKQLSSLHGRLAQQLQTAMEDEHGIPEWMGVGRTVLIMKDKAKGPVVDNYRPITCLPTTWKLFSSIVAEEVYRHLEEHCLWPVEQKGCKKLSRGTKDQLLIDKMILRDCRERKVGLHTAWIDYKKAYDSVPHSWLLKSLEMLKVNAKTRRCLENAMGKWKTELTVNNETIGECNIRRGIFQGDALSPLWFVAAMVPLTKLLNSSRKGYQLRNHGLKVNHLLFMDDLKLYAKSEAELKELVTIVYEFSSDIKMEFGLGKCATMKMNRGKLEESVGLPLPDDQFIAGLKAEDCYKYLGILEADSIKHKKMKERIRQEYLRRVRKVLKSNLNAGNAIQAINVWAVSSFRYSAGVVDWTKAELREVDAKTRKLLTMHKAHHPRASVARLYLSREDGGRGLKSIEEAIEKDKRGIVEYLDKSNEALLRKVLEANVVEVEGNSQDYVKEKHELKLAEWKSKALHGQYVRDMTVVAEKQSTWQWLTSGRLKKETEGLIIAAQDQALRTNAIKVHIDKQGGSALCRLCGDKEETVDHLVSSCGKIAQTEYKGRHDRVAASLHWSLCKHFGFAHAEKWYEHRAEKVIENEKCKLLWDFDVKTDKVISARRPDLLIVHKEKREATIIDVAIPGDSRIASKEAEKKTKYRDLAVELQRLWELRNVKVVPIVIGALGAVTPMLGGYLKGINVEHVTVGQLQRTTLLGTANILRRYLGW